MLKCTRSIVAALMLVFLCISIFSTGMMQEDMFVSAQETPASGQFLKVDTVTEVRGVGGGMIGFYDEETGKSGFLDMDGNIAIPARYYNVGTFCEGLASAGATPYASGYIDYTGQFVIPPVFHWGSEFNRGKAIVYSFAAGYQVINQAGTFLLTKSYEYMFYDKQFNQYFATADERTDVLDDQLNVLYTIPYSMNSIYQVDGRPVSTFWGNDPQCYGAFDLATGKVIVMEQGSGYAMIQNGMLYFNSEEKQTTNIYSLHDGALLGSFGMENVFPINEKTFYTSTDNVSYITKNGVKSEVDYRIYSELLPGLFLVNTNPDPNAPDQDCYGIIDQNADMLLPAVYDYIYGDYRIYLTGVTLSGIFLAQKGNICEVYDAKANKIAAYENILRCGSTGTLYYLVDTKGFTTVLDKTGKQLEGIDTDERGIDYGWENLLVSYGEDTKQNQRQPIFYVYIDETVSQKSALTYEPDTGSPALSSSDITDLLMQIPSKTESYFTTSQFVKNDINGNITLPNDWVPKSQITEGRTYLHPSTLTEAFRSFGYSLRQDACELYYQDKVLRLTYGKKEAKLTYYDATNRSVAEKMLVLEAPALAPEPIGSASKETGGISDILPDDKTYQTGMIDSMAFVPLRTAAEALGLYVSWHDGLIGVSNMPINLNRQQAAEKKSTLTDMVFSPSDLKALDASLATQPYVDKLVKQTLGVTEVWDNICAYTNTIPGYEALINKTKDIILVTEPSKEMLALAASKGIELELTPFAKEGFVFLINESNPVDTLSVGQLKDIYAGKITNWKEVGGPDAPILAYQRNESSGSQTIMENVFMKDEKLMNPPTERRVMSMAGLVDVIAEFTGEVNHSIGYSVYYYATQMYGNDMVKLVKVDGVKPDSATIANDTYPLVVNYYIVTRKGDMTPFATQMKDYVLSPAGQKLLTDVGLVPIK